MNRSYDGITPLTKHAVKYQFLFPLIQKSATVAQETPESRSKTKLHVSVAYRIATVC